MTASVRSVRAAAKEGRQRLKRPAALALVVLAALLLAAAAMSWYARAALVDEREFSARAVGRPG